MSRFSSWRPIGGTTHPGGAGDGGAALIRRGWLLCLAVLVGLSVSCAGAALPKNEASGEPPEPPAEPEPEPEPPKAEEPVRVPIPTECASADSKFCTPDADFVDVLCRTTRPNVALSMFQKGTPWTRARVLRDLEAWYVGGARSAPSKLKYGEEVLMLAERNKSTGGIKVSGAGSFDVLRWDGTCVSLMSNEMAISRHGGDVVATISWKDLHADIREALKKDRHIEQHNIRRREACNDTSPGAERRCERARIALSRMISNFLRKGGEAPLPNHVQ